MAKKKSKKFICYNYDKSGHKRIKCPNNKRLNKKKALQATLDKSDDDEREYNESQRRSCQHELHSNQR